MRSIQLDFATERFVSIDLRGGQCLQAEPFQLRGVYVSLNGMKYLNEERRISQAGMLLGSQKYAYSRLVTSTLDRLPGHFTALLFDCAPGRRDDRVGGIASPDGGARFFRLPESPAASG